MGILENYLSAEVQEGGAVWGLVSPVCGGGREGTLPTDVPWGKLRLTGV